MSGQCNWLCGCVRRILQFLVDTMLPVGCKCVYTNRSDVEQQLSSTESIDARSIHTRLDQCNVALHCPQFARLVILTARVRMVLMAVSSDFENWGAILKDARLASYQQGIYSGRPKVFLALPFGSIPHLVSQGNFPNPVTLRLIRLKLFATSDQRELRQGE